MKNNEEQCPKCLGIGELMEAKLTKGFEYKKCSLCNGTGSVDSQIADDFIFAMNGENNFETNDDW